MLRQIMTRKPLENNIGGRKRQRQPRSRQLNVTGRRAILGHIVLSIALIFSFLILSNFVTFNCLHLRLTSGIHNPCFL